MEADRDKREKDEYREGVSLRNGWRCRFCGARPKPGKSFGADGVCHTCRDRLDHLQG